MPDAPRTPLAAPSRWRRWSLLIVAAVVLVFGRSVGFDFVTLDDETHVSADPHLNPFTAASLAAFWARPYHGLYIPATYTAWGLLSFVARTPPTAGRPTLDPAVFHAANVALHAANAVLVWLILRRVLGGADPDDASPSPLVAPRIDGPRSAKPRAAAPALIGALVFALHPVQAEPVGWVSGFKDTFSGFWSLLAVLIFLRSVATVGRPVWGGYAAATVAFAVALCAKPAAVVVPPMAAVLAWAGGDRRPRRTLALLAPWLVLAVPIVWVTHGQQSDVTAMTWDPPAVRPLVAADALAFYARQVAWPADLAVDYGRTPTWVWDHRAAAAAGIATTVLAVAAALFLCRRRRPVPAGVAVFVVGVGPVLGLVPFIYQQFSTVSDRYLYLPMVGVGLIAAWAVAATGRRGVIVAVAVVAALAVRTAVQVGTWRDTAHLFTHTLTVNPSSAMAYDGLATAAERSGRLAEAESADRAAVRLDPAEPKYHLALYRVLARTGRPAEAQLERAEMKRSAAMRVLRLDPDSPAAHRGLAEAYAALGRPADAAAESARADQLRAAGRGERTPVRPD